MHVFLAVTAGAFAVPIVSAVVGAMIGSIGQATIEARKAKRELDQADTHDLLQRIHDLEMFKARYEGRSDYERKTRE